MSVMSFRKSFLNDFFNSEIPNTCPGGHHSPLLRVNKHGKGKKYCTCRSERVKKVSWLCNIPEILAYKYAL